MNILLYTKKDVNNHVEEIFIYKNKRNELPKIQIKDIEEKKITKEIISDIAFSFTNFLGIEDESIIDVRYNKTLNSISIECDGIVLEKTKISNLKYFFFKKQTIYHVPEFDKYINKDILTTYYYRSIEMYDSLKILEYNEKEKEKEKEKENKKKNKKKMSVQSLMNITKNEKFEK